MQEMFNLLIISNIVLLYVFHKCNQFELKGLRKEMAKLQDAVVGVVSAEQALEARVAAHEAKDVETVAALQAQIDALTQAGADVPGAVQALTDLKARIEGFDSTAPA